MSVVFRSGSLNRLRFGYGRHIENLQTTMAKVVGASYGEREIILFVNIDFDNQSAVASISLEGWAQPLVEFLTQYFTIQEDTLVWTTHIYQLRTSLLQLRVGHVLFKQCVSPFCAT